MAKIFENNVFFRTEFFLEMEHRDAMIAGECSAIDGEFFSMNMKNMREGRGRMQCSVGKGWGVATRRMLLLGSLDLI